MTTTKKITFEPKKVEEQRFEFVLYINNHIICQRYFGIRDFNKNTLNIDNIKDMMDSISGMNIDNIGKMGIIPNHLKEKSVDYLWGGYNPYSPSQEQTVKTIFDKLDDFQFEVKIDKKVIAKSIFSGNYFQPRVRYAVDIKEIIPSIISEIRYFLSEKN
jgi:hypothetical protein